MCAPRNRISGTDASSNRKIGSPNIVVMSFSMGSTRRKWSMMTVVSLNNSLFTCRRICSSPSTIASIVPQCVDTLSASAERLSTMPDSRPMAASGWSSAVPSLPMTALSCGPVPAVAAFNWVTRRPISSFCSGSGPSSCSDSSATACSVSVRLFGVSVRVRHCPGSHRSGTAPLLSTARSRSVVTLRDSVVAAASARTGCAASTANSTRTLSPAGRTSVTVPTGMPRIVT